MNGNHLVKIRQRIIFDWNHRAIMPCVVHQDVDPAEFFAARGDDMRARAPKRRAGRPYAAGPPLLEIPAPLPPSSFSLPPPRNTAAPSVAKRLAMAPAIPPPEPV